MMRKIKKLVVYAAFCSMAGMVLSCSCGDKKTDNASSDPWVRPENLDTIADIPTKEVNDTITIQGRLYRFNYKVSAVDSLPVVTSFSGQRYHDNCVTLTINGDSSQLLRRTFLKNDFSGHIPAVALKKSALVDFNYFPAKRSDHSRFHFLAIVGDPEDNDENAYFMDVVISNGGEVHFEPAKNEDLSTMPIDYEEETEP